MDMEMIIKLSRIDFKIIETIKDLSQKYGVCISRNIDISNILGVSVSYIKKRLRFLEECNIIKRFDKNSSKRKILLIHNPLEQKFYDDSLASSLEVGFSDMNSVEGDHIDSVLTFPPVDDSDNKLDDIPESFNVDHEDEEINKEHIVKNEDLENNLRDIVDGIKKDISSGKYQGEMLDFVKNILKEAEDNYERAICKSRKEYQ